MYLDVSNHGVSTIRVDALEDAESLLKIILGLNVVVLLFETNAKISDTGGQLRVRFALGNLLKDLNSPTHILDRFRVVDAVVKEDVSNGTPKSRHINVLVLLNETDSNA
jgi:hypothetical protein